MTGRILVNPSAGDPATGADAIRERFVGHVIVECDPASFDSAISDVLDDGAEFLGMAGGDGSMRSVAHRLRETDVPLLVIPAGTRNHLAGDLGIDTVDDAYRATEQAAVRRIDIGDANGETFVNNLSIGLYPKMVATRERHQRRLPKPIANLIAAFDQVVHGRTTRITVDGEEHEAWAVFVGNGRYGSRVSDLTTREALDDGVLDVRVVRADRRFARLRVTIAVLLGRLQHSPLVEQEPTDRLTIVARRAAIDVALDGEVVHLASPIEVRCVPSALSVLVPAGEAAEHHR